MYHQIYVGENITLENGGIFAKQILERAYDITAVKGDSNNKIAILINSLGGSIRGLQTIMGAIEVAKNTGIKIVTVNMGVSCSSSAILFLQGDERYVMPGSELEFLSYESTKFIRLFDYIHSSEKDYKMFVEEMTKNSNLSSLEIKKRIKKKDFVVTANEAIEFGFANKIITQIR